MFIKCWTSDEWSAVVWRFILLTCVLYIFQFWPGRDTAEYGGNMGPSGKSQIRRDNSPHNTHHLSRENLCLTRSASSIFFLALFFGWAIFIFCSQPLSLCTSSGEETLLHQAPLLRHCCVWCSGRIDLLGGWQMWLRLRLRLRLIDEVKRLTFRL